MLHLRLVLHTPSFKLFKLITYPVLPSLFLYSPVCLCSTLLSFRHYNSLLASRVSQNITKSV